MQFSKFNGKEATVKNTAIRCLCLSPLRLLVLLLGIHLAMAVTFGNYLYASDAGDFKGFTLSKNNTIVSDDLTAKDFQNHDFGNFWSKKTVSTANVIATISCAASSSAMFTPSMTPIPPSFLVLGRFRPTQMFGWKNQIF